jgi:S-formylglutathione hydrolase FrmB
VTLPTAAAHAPTLLLVLTEPLLAGCCEFQRTDADGAHRLEVLATKYPVVYYLHGRGDDENYLLQESEGGFCELLHNAMAQQMVPEVIYVMAHAGRHAGYCDSVDGSVMGETVIIGELLPHIESTYRTTGERALQGWSMGGQGALLLGFKYPSLFSSVIGMASGLCTGEELLEELPQVFGVMHSSVDQYDENSAWAWVQQNAELLRAPAPGVGPAIQIICGEQDPQLYRSERMHETLDALGIEHGYREAEDVGHESARVYPFFAMVRRMHQCTVQSDAPFPIPSILAVRVLSAVVWRLASYCTRSLTVISGAYAQVGMLFHADHFPSAAQPKL